MCQKRKRAQSVRHYVTDAADVTAAKFCPFRRISHCSHLAAHVSLESVPTSKGIDVALIANKPNVAIGDNGLFLLVSWGKTKQRPEE